MPQNGPFLLLVEDNFDDEFFFRRSLQSANLTCCLQVARTGPRAIAYLQQSQDKGGFPRPDVIFLDLKLPGVSGFDVLKWVRNQPHTSTVPVVIFTGSNSATDETLAYALGADCVLNKPARAEDLTRLVGSRRVCSVCNDEDPALSP